VKKVFVVLAVLSSLLFSYSCCPCHCRCPEHHCCPCR